MDHLPESINRPAVCGWDIERGFNALKKNVLEPLSEQCTRTNLLVCLSTNISVLLMPKTQHVVIIVADCRSPHYIMYLDWDMWLQHLAYFLAPLPCYPE